MINLHVNQKMIPFPFPSELLDLYTMVRMKSILLIAIMIIMICPWQSICIAHPFGHDHQPHENSSPCELRRQYPGKGPAFFPPMDCEHVAPQFEDFEKILNVRTALFSSAILTIAIANIAVLKNISIQPCVVGSNSDPPFFILKDRAPPGYL